jgi:hypothetical protein
MKSMLKSKENWPLTFGSANWGSMSGYRIYLKEKRFAMTLNITLQPLLAITAGILILAKPNLLNYIVAIFLIAFGILELIQ